MKTKLIMALTLLALAAIPVLADDARTTSATTTAAVELAADEATALETTATERVAAEAQEASADVETWSDEEVWSFLGLAAPLTDFYGPGYCYHDCSTCFSRDDCKEPGFPFGFPCTEIPLC